MPLTRKTPLRAKTPLKSRSTIKRTKAEKASTPKDTKPKAKSISQLKKDADKYFSTYVRYRDGRYSHARGWETICITCGRWRPLKQMQAGHFVTRTISDLRFDEENVNGQCYSCNVMRHGELYIYGQQLDIKYGQGTAERLAARRQVIHKFKREELEQIIADAKVCITHYQKEEGAPMDTTPKPEPEKKTKKKVDDEATAKKKRAKLYENTAITNPEDPANRKYQRRKIDVIQK